MIERSEAVKAELRKRAQLAGTTGKATVIVGYTAKYALWVHESVGMTMKGLPRTVWFTKGGKRYKTNIPKKGFYWDPQGQATAKFLEGPFREHKKEISKIVIRVYKATGDLGKSLLVAGLFLQRMSQRRVPVYLGNLKNSAFTRKQ